MPNNIHDQELTFNVKQLYRRFQQQRYGISKPRMANISEAALNLLNSTSIDTKEFSVFQIYDVSTQIRFQKLRAEKATL